MAEPNNTISAVKAIRDFFSTPGHPVTMDELKSLSIEERNYLGQGAADALGKTLVKSNV